jgi:hypothetical protein
MPTPDATLTSAQPTVPALAQPTVPASLSPGVPASATAPVPADRDAAVLAPGRSVPNAPRTAPGGRADRTDQRPLEETSPRMVVDHSARHGLSWIQIVAIVIVGAVIAALAVYGAEASYLSLRTLAITYNLPSPRIAPIGIDGGLLGFVAFDIVLTWIGKPLWLIRWMARLLSLATIVLNALAGWPQPIAVGLHTFAPTIVVAVIEAVRILLLRSDDQDIPAKAEDDDDSEGIPWLRWVIAPFSTFVIWRRMILWRVRSYAKAIDMELSRRRAIVRLAGHFGQSWQVDAPNDLVWMLRKGVRLDEACARVELIIAPVQTPASKTNPGDPPNSRSTGRGRRRRTLADRPDARGRSRAAQNGADPVAQNGGGTATENGAGTGAQNGAGTAARNRLHALPGTGAAGRPGDAADPANDAALLARGREIFAAFRAENGRPPTLDEFTPLLGRARSIASKVRRTLRDELEATKVAAQ